MKKEIMRHSSPFFSRTYGAFSADQVVFLRANLPRMSATILDPMAGQAADLARFAREGHAVWVGDLNPGPRALARLRAPDRLRSANELALAVLKWAGSVALDHGPVEDRADFDAGWLTASTAVALMNTVARAGEAPGAHSGFQELVADLLVLAARDVCTYRASDNASWLMPGGLARPADVRARLSAAAEAWAMWAMTTSVVAGGALHVRAMNAVNGIFADAPVADFIATSPPYANRMDYARLWGPEVAVSNALRGDADAGELARAQLGSNFVRGRPIDVSTLAPLSPQTRTQLLEIRDDREGKASAGYYFPFFAHYALGLHAAVKNLALRLATEGTLAMIVRDTVRRDVLLSSAEVVRHAASSAGLVELPTSTRRVVRSHIGLRRRGAEAGVYGLAQQEWWLAFRKTGES